MKNLSGSMEGYETLADNHIKSKKTNINKVNEDIIKLDIKEFKSTLNDIIKKHDILEKDCKSLREIKYHKEFYDALISLNNFKESISKIEMIYN